MPWSGRNFQHAFARLALPITTANEKLVADWQTEYVWPPFYATVRETIQTDPLYRELLHVVMNFRGGTEAHRVKLQDFVDLHVPGYRLVFESDILPALNQVLVKRGSNERVLGFRYGKDGRGAMPDRYYHLLLTHGYMVVGNHHDVLGHLALFGDPRIRAITEGLSRSFCAGLETHHQMREANRLDARAFERETLGLRRALRLYTLAWNLAQEKLYVRVPAANGETTLNLLGAFNSVYNTIFSERVTAEQTRSVAAALGFFNRDPMQSILMPTSVLRRYCLEAGGRENAEFKQALENYAQVWSAIGLSEGETADLAERFEAVVGATLLERRWFGNSISRRWPRFARGVQYDERLSRIFHKTTLLDFSEALVRVADAFLRDLGGLRDSVPAD